jgi:branched-chain amino acid transport system ATP-binding protein
MTVRDNLELAGTPQRKRGRPRTAALDRVYELFPRLQQREHQKAFSLSGGEQQMLAVGRALMADPQVMLLDEPSLGLAPFLVTEVFKTLAQIRADGVTLVLVEQNAGMALHLADRAYVLVQGEVVLSGTADELRGDERLQAAYLGGPRPTSRLSE